LWRIGRALGEYPYGIGRSRFRRRCERWLAENADAFTILEIGTATASYYAAIRRELRDALDRRAGP
jgi:predicted nucleic acid-binding protein